MYKLNTVTEELNEIVIQIKKLIKDKDIRYWQSFQTLFELNPELERITVNLNNHAFNDGDDTYFSFYYDDKEEYGITGKLTENTLQDIKTIFSIVEDFHEEMVKTGTLGKMDEYSVSIDRTTIKSQLEQLIK